MRSLRGMVRLDHPEKVQLVDGGSDRLLGRGVARADWSFCVAGVGLLELAKGAVVGSLGSGRILPLGTFSPAGERRVAHHGPRVQPYTNIPGSYEVLLFTALDFPSITSHVHNRVSFCFLFVSSFFLELVLH